MRRADMYHTYMYRAYVCHTNMHRAEMLSAYMTRSAPDMPPPDKRSDGENKLPLKWG